MLNRGLNCVIRPNEFDFAKEQEVNPISGYGIIPLLMAGAQVGMGMMDKKAKAKQGKKDLKAAMVEEKRQQEEVKAANQRKQTIIIISVAGLAVVGAIAYAAKKKKRR